MKRLQEILFLLLCAFTTASILSLIVCCVTYGFSAPDFANLFMRGFAICFIVFSGSFAIAAFLVLITNIGTVNAIQYGAAFYYSTAVLFTIVNNYTDKVTAAILSAIIAGQFCYIFWLKRNKS